MKKKTKYNDSWIYIFLLSSFTILFDTLSNYNINIYNVTISSSYLLLPLIFYLQNIIFNKFSNKTNISSILISILSVFVFSIIMDFSLGKEIILKDLSLELVILMIASYINLLFFNYIKYETKEPYILILISYLLVNIIYHLIYVLFNINSIVFKYYFKEYILVIFIQFIIIIIISIIDKITIRKKKTKFR